jgi:hypothetical protein
VGALTGLFDAVTAAIVTAGHGVALQAADWHHPGVNKFVGCPDVGGSSDGHTGCRILDLSYSDLTGAIPASLGSLTGLTWVAILPVDGDAYIDGFA